MQTTVVTCWSAANGTSDSEGISWACRHDKKRNFWKKNDRYLYKEHDYEFYTLLSFRLRKCRKRRKTMNSKSWWSSLNHEGDRIGSFSIFSRFIIWAHRMEHWHCWHRTQICESWGLAWTWIEERGTRTCCLTSFPTYSPSHNSRVWIITMRFNFRLRNLTRNQKLLWNSSSSSENRQVLVSNFYLHLSTLSLE